MRFTVASVYTIILALLVVLSATGTGYIFVRLMQAQQVAFREVLLAEEAKAIAASANRHFSNLEIASDRQITAAELAQEIINAEYSPYEGVVWNNNGDLVLPESAPEWAVDIPSGQISKWMGQYVETGLTNFRLDNFDNFRSGVDRTAMCIDVVYIPDYEIFAGIGGPLNSLSARLNAVRTTTDSAWRWWSFGIGVVLALVIVLVLVGSNFYFQRAVTKPLLSLVVNGNKTSNTIGQKYSFAWEVNELGCKIHNLEDNLRSTEMDRNQFRNNLASSREELDLLRGNFDHVLHETQRELEQRYKALYEKDRKGLYNRLNNYLRIKDQDAGANTSLDEKINVILKNQEFGKGVMDDDFEYVLCSAWLPDLVRMYAIERGMPAPKVNVQSTHPIRVNVNLMNEVVYELLDNAYLNLEGDGEVFLNCSEADGGVELSIGNFGKGIKQDERDIVFSPFYSTLDGHIGLGLAWASALLKSMGCSLSVYSEENKGCVAVIRIPLDTVEV